MRISAAADIKGFKKQLAQVEKQRAFAISLALNNTAKDFQKEERRVMGDQFTIRRKTWVERSVKIGPGDWAKKDKHEAVVRLETPGDKSRSNILSQHEAGGVKTPEGESLAIPIGAKRGKTGVVTKAQRPRSLNLRTTGPNTAEGDKGAFLVKTSDGKGAIMQRDKRGKVRVLFGLTPRARLRPKLKFEDTGRRVVKARAEVNMRRAFIRAISTARW